MQETASARRWLCAFKSASGSYVGGGVGGWGGRVEGRGIGGGGEDKRLSISIDPRLVIHQYWCT
jgi:hypothetical protein